MPLTVRLVSWNIHKCVGGLDRRHDPARTASVLQALTPDVVLLQEVAQNGARFGGQRQVELLAAALGLAHCSYFVNVRFGPHRGEYGNAILSRAPIHATENVDLTIAGKKARSALHAELRFQLPDDHSRICHVFNLHLGLGEAERREQLRRLLACRPLQAIHAHTPAIVAGDFNDVYGSLGKQLLAPAGFRGPSRPLRTFPAWAPLRALDSLWVRGDVDVLTLERHRGRGTRMASDHLPLFAELQLLPPHGDARS